MQASDTEFVLWNIHEMTLFGMTHFPNGVRGFWHEHWLVYCLHRCGFVCFFFARIFFSERTERKRKTTIPREETKHTRWGDLNGSQSVKRGKEKWWISIVRFQNDIRTTPMICNCVFKQNRVWKTQKWLQSVKPLQKTQQWLFLIWLVGLFICSTRFQV